MSTDFADALQPLLTRLIRLAQDDADVRRELRAAAERVLEFLDGSEPAAAVLPSPAAAVVADEPVAPPPPLPPLTLGGPPGSPPPDAARDSTKAPDLPEWLSRPVSDDELGWIEKRARLKAEAARWVGRRGRLLATGADLATEIRPQDHELISRARALPDCFLWMLMPDAGAPEGPDGWDDIAGSYEALGVAAGLLRAMISTDARDTPAFQQGLDLAAEVQSALRRALELAGARADCDQDRMFAWIRHVALEDQIFVARHMRLNDPADPEAWSDRLERLELLAAGHAEESRRRHQVRNLLGRISYHVRLILRNSADDHEHDWSRVVQAVDDLVGSGLAPSNIELRDLLLPVIDAVPDGPGVPDGVIRVVREIERYLASRVDLATTAPASGPSREATEARALLAGRAVVLIGGEDRPHARRALEQAFGLSKLLWIATAPHESVHSFESVVARPEVACVLLAIRWSSHSYGDVRRFCERYGKPLVRLKAGYSVNRVAFDVLSQVSAQLLQR